MSPLRLVFSKIYELPFKAAPRVLLVTPRTVYFTIRCEVHCLDRRLLRTIDSINLNPYDPRDMYGQISQLTCISTKTMHYQLVAAFKFRLECYIICRIKSQTLLVAKLKRIDTTIQGRTLGAFFNPRRNNLYCLGEFGVCQWLSLPLEL